MKFRSDSLLKITGAFFCLFLSEKAISPKVTLHYNIFTNEIKDILPVENDRTGLLVHSTEIPVRSLIFLPFHPEIYAFHTLFCKLLSKCRGITGLGKP